MKFSAVLLAASANASTLFSPIYEYVAQSLVSQASGMLTGLTALDTPLDIAGNAALVAAINDFNTALTTMDNAALVSIIEGIDVNNLFDADGNFNTDALVTVFSGLDPAVVQALQDQFVAAIPAETMTTINSSMEAFLDLGTVFQDLMNSEIELSNFAAVYNDFASAVTQLDSAFDNQILGSSTNALLSYSTLITTLGEKFLVVNESRDDIRIAFRNANTLVEFAVGDILDTIGHTDGNSVWCSAAQNGILSTTKQFVDFLPDVVITNYYPPVSSAVNVYNDFIHGLSFSNFNLGQYKIDEAQLQAAVTMFGNTSAQISGSLTELNALVTTFLPQVNNAFERILC